MTTLLRIPILIAFCLLMTQQVYVTADREDELVKIVSRIECSDVCEHVESPDYYNCLDRCKILSTQGEARQTYINTDNEGLWSCPTGPCDTTALLRIKQLVGQLCAADDECLDRLVNFIRSSQDEPSLINQRRRHRNHRVAMKSDQMFTVSRRGGFADPKSVCISYHCTTHRPGSVLLKVKHTDLVRFFSK